LINCGHTFYPFFEGFSEQTYFPYDKEQNDEAYKLSQQQRRLEVKIRKEKQFLIANKGEGKEADFKAHSIKLKKAERNLKEFMAENDLQQQPRTSVVGFGRSEAMRSVWADKKALQSGGDGGIININTGNNRGAGAVDTDKIPFLTKKSTGEITKVTIEQVKASGLRGLKKDGWLFDWREPFKNGFEVYQLKIEDDSRLQGLIAIKDISKESSILIDIVESAPHNMGSGGEYKGVGPNLFAYAGKVSIDKGYNYVYFESKTPLIEYYKKELGAIQLGRSQTMILEGEALYKLVNRYYGR